MNTNRLISLLTMIFVCNFIIGQSMNKEMMQNLDYLVGEWIGTTKIYENGEVSKQGAAFEKISYDLGGSILVIELNTEFLQLHTIVTYSEEDEKYYYHRFSKSGAAIYPAEFKDGHLIVWKDEKTRFFFTKHLEDGFQEYGEALVEGEWVRTFEDTFVNTK